MPSAKHTVLILNHSFKSPFRELDVQYARLFDPRHYEVTIAYLTGLPDPGASPPAVCETLFFNLPREELRRLKRGAIRRVRDLCRERRFRVAICHRYKPTYIISWVARTCPIPFKISVMHDFKTLHRWTHRLFVYTRLRHDFVFAGVSDAVRDDLYRDGWGLKREQVVTLPNSIEVSEVAGRQLDRQAARRELGLPPEAFVLGTVGRLHPAKDHSTLIRAVAAAASLFPELRLVIIGSGPLEMPLRAAIRSHGLEDRVTLAGFVPEASRLMQAFDVYVSSSRKEPFGMVLLEAMAAGRPIVATAVDGVPQVLGEVGCLVPPENPRALAEAIADYAGRPAGERARLGERCRERVNRHFTTETFKEAFWNLFRPRGLEP